MHPSIEHRLCGVGDQYHRIIAASIDGSMIVSFQVGVHHSSLSSSFLAVVAESTQAPVVIAETEISAPRSSWELRADGLWADHICESPFEHWSYGLEAFALRLEDPAELLGLGYGERVPLGWELEFESITQPRMVTDSESSFDYTQKGICHGILLFKNREVAFEGQALRQHWAAKPVPETTSLNIPASGERSISRIALPADDRTWWLAIEPTSITWDQQPE